MHVRPGRGEIGKNDLRRKPVGTGGNCQVMQQENTPGKADFVARRRGDSPARQVHIHRIVQDRQPPKISQPIGSEPYHLLGHLVVDGIKGQYSRTPQVVLRPRHPRRSLFKQQ